MEVGKLLKIGLLITILCVALGCGGESIDKVNNETDALPSYRLRVLFSTNIAEDLTSVLLTIADTENNVIKSLSLPIEAVEGDPNRMQATARISLEPEKSYVFDVKVWQEEYLIGWAHVKQFITEDQTDPIVITVTVNPPDVNPTRVDVILEETDADCLTLPALTATIDGKRYAFVYADTNALTNFFPSGWMGDFNDIEYKEILYDSNKTDPGETSICITYTPSGTKRWAGIYWLPVPNLEDDWSNIVFGIDLTKDGNPNKLTWYAKGEEGVEKIEFFVGGVDDIDDVPPCRVDSLSQRNALSQSNEIIIELTTEWQQYEIDLSSVPSDQLKYVVGGFGWAASKKNNPTGIKFYMDDIKFSY